MHTICAISNKVPSHSYYGRHGGHVVSAVLRFFPLSPRSSTCRYANLERPIPVHDLRLLICRGLPNRVSALALPSEKFGGILMEQPFVPGFGRTG